MTKLIFGYLSREVSVRFTIGTRSKDDIVPIDDVFTLNERVAPIAEHIRSFVLSSGRLQFDLVCNSGTWTFILVRTTEFGQSMLVVWTFGLVNPHQMLP
jgi:hypothetical protein